jgi:transposase
VKGRQRHLLVDTLGLLLKVVVAAAHVSDAAGGRRVGHALRTQGPALPRLVKRWADSAYAGTLEDWLREQFGWTLELVRRPPDQQGFPVQAHRWIVESTQPHYPQCALDVQYSACHDRAHWAA